MSKHRARFWVEEHFPAARGSAKAALILAYGAGLDAGFAEAQEVIEEATVEFRRRVLEQDLPPTLVVPV